MKLTDGGAPYLYDNEMAVIIDATDAFGKENSTAYVNWLDYKLSRIKRLAALDSTEKKKKAK